MQFDAKGSHDIRPHTALEMTPNPHPCLIKVTFPSITFKCERLGKYLQTAQISSDHVTYYRLICKSHRPNFEVHPRLSWCFRFGNLTLAEASSHSVFISRINAASVSFPPRDPVGCNPSSAEQIPNLSIHSRSPRDTGVHFLWIRVCTTEFVQYMARCLHH